MGLETAKLILKEGGRVVLVGNRADKAEQARQALAAMGDVAVIAADLMSEAGMHRDGYGEYRTPRHQPAGQCGRGFLAETIY